MTFEGKIKADDSEKVVDKPLPGGELQQIQGRLVQMCGAGRYWSGGKVLDQSETNLIPTESSDVSH